MHIMEYEVSAHSVSGCEDTRSTLPSQHTRDNVEKSVSVVRVVYHERGEGLPANDGLDCDRPAVVVQLEQHPFEREGEEGR